MVSCLLIILWPLSRPIAFLLDVVLPHQDERRMRRNEIRAFIEDQVDPLGFIGITHSASASLTSSSGVTTASVTGGGGAVDEMNIDEWTLGNGCNPLFTAHIFTMLCSVYRPLYPL